MQAQTPNQIGTSIHFFDATSLKLYIYRMENPLDLNIVHIEVGDSAKQMDEYDLLDQVKKISVEKGYIFAHEDVAMIC
jgi:hypothetical protein